MTAEACSFVYVGERDIDGEPVERCEVHGGVKNGPDLHCEERPLLTSGAESKEPPPEPCCDGTWYGCAYCGEDPNTP